MKALFLGGSQNLVEKELDAYHEKYTTIHAGDEVIDFPGEPSPAKRPDKVKREVYTKRKLIIPNIYMLEGMSSEEGFYQTLKMLLEVYNNAKAQQEIRKDSTEKETKKEVSRKS